MPSRNIVKIYVEKGIYHIYNRGVEKRTIFQDNQDFKVFLKFLKDALSPPPDPKILKINVSLKGETFKGIPKLPLSFYGKIEMLAYCLMPNHFHLLIKQKAHKTIKQFIQSIATRYSIYFNKKYHRVGSLFQGPYKAVLVMEEPYLLHLSRYIHQNPLQLSSNLIESFSSYADYIGFRKTPWLNTQFILSSFGSSLAKILNTRSYRDFVEKWKGNSEDILGKLTLEDSLTSTL